jgi:hypothetical protein
LNTSASIEALRRLPLAARKLLCVAAGQAYHGALKSKRPGTATMPEVHEACGLDVDQLYSLLELLKQTGLVLVEGQYPFEELRFPASIQTVADLCARNGIPLEQVLVDLRSELIGL